MQMHSTVSYNTAYVSVSCRNLHGGETMLPTTLCMGSVFETLLLQEFYFYYAKKCTRVRICYDILDSVRFKIRCFICQ